ncbi:ABC transporter permease subunit [Peribacillus deserti]|uniref:ABC transmembrane type-1 domain-containing protein n=1 Tax=Peribacillus deserti TaxID=673318 RepID=A0A2N5M147_9BACI|nr:ABC transporter permease subunit [Peribacillus deserti]PLT28070.1 hypothetical protein CUU66_20675 [Peribacillus deserti]
MTQNIRINVLELLVTMICIVLIVCLPSLIVQEDVFGFHLISYVESVLGTCKNLFQINDASYVMESGKILSLFPDAFERYAYSMLILLSALLFSLIVTILLSYGYTLSSVKIKKGIQNTLVILESLPDVLIVAVAQFTVIWLFKKTNLLLFDVVSVPDDRSYILPILCLSILPLIQLFKFFVMQVEEEKVKPYIQFANGRGFTKSYILWIHILRNVLIHLFYHSKTIFLFLLSNLFVLEIMFNMDGIMNLIKYNVKIPEIMAIGIILIYVPFFIFFKCILYFVAKLSGMGEVEQ